MSRYLQPSDVGKTFKTHNGRQVTVRAITLNGFGAVVYEGLCTDVGVTRWNILGWRINSLEGSKKLNEEERVLDWIVFDD